MEKFEVINVEDDIRWMQMLQQVKTYDVYHLPSYHRLSEINGEGKGVLLGYTKDDLVVVFPLLLRNIDSISGLESIGKNWYDAVSVYGYAGPLASRELNPTEKVSFYSHLQDFFDASKIVSVFTSVNPLLGQASILSGFGNLIPTNPTISIDLTLPQEIQWRNYRKSERNRINGLIKKGFICMEDTYKKYWDGFVDLYYATMKRVCASNYYYFPPKYFFFMKSKMKKLVRLFVCFYDNKLVSAGTVTSCHGIIQTLIGGVTMGEYSHLGPGRLLINTIRLWGNEKGDHTLHLGRGIGGQNDSLLHYKKGFSKREHPFYFWRLINNHKIYYKFIEILLCKTCINPEGDYFPEYRNPTFLNHYNSCY